MNSNSTTSQSNKEILDNCLEFHKAYDESTEPQQDLLDIYICCVTSSLWAQKDEIEKINLSETILTVIDFIHSTRHNTQPENKPTQSK